MSTLIDWNPTLDPSEVVREARSALGAGKVIILPGDSGYLALMKPAAPGGFPSPALLCGNPNTVAERGITVPLAARRLMHRAWPAPLVIELPTTVDLPAAAAGYVRLRCPDHPLYEVLIPALAEDGLVLVAETGTSSAAEAIARHEATAALIVVAGELNVQRPTVVRITNPPASAPCLEGAGSSWEIVKAGCISQDDLEKLTARIVLFVCTGNTCRSPLAEALAKKLLADRLGCAIEELPSRGFWLQSAGVTAFGGGAASEESRLVADELGANLSNHVSRQLSPRLLQAADDVIAMTASHVQVLESRFPGMGPPPRLLCGIEDLEDPIGAGMDVYRTCAHTILQQLERLIPEWVGS